MVSGVMEKLTAMRPMWVIPSSPSVPTGVETALSELETARVRDVLEAGANHAHGARFEATQGGQLLHSDVDVGARQP
jgi:hypothetical protein